MRTKFFAPLLVVFICSCAPIKKIRTGTIETPALGALGKKEKSLLTDEFIQIGQPNLTSPIAISVTEQPFTRSTFRTYQELKKQKGELLEVEFVDSLPIKPKFLSFDMSDKIGLVTLLNKTENSEVSSYLSKDADYKIVSNIKLYLDPGKAINFIKNDGVFLVTDHKGALKVEVWHGTKKELLSLPTTEIFEYEVSSFCWGEDTYGKLHMQALSEDGGCPSGTEKDPNKVSQIKSYLKL